MKIDSIHIGDERVIHAINTEKFTDMWGESMTVCGIRLPSQYHRRSEGRDWYTCPNVDVSCQECLDAMDVAFSRSKSESPIEESFWKAARVNVPGLVQQYQIGRYRLDLAVPQIKLGIELNGHEFHSSKEQRKYDAIRDRTLLLAGWRIVRFTGSEIHEDVARCVLQLNQIIEVLSQPQTD